MLDATQTCEICFVSRNGRLTAWPERRSRAAIVFVARLLYSLMSAQETTREDATKKWLAHNMVDPCAFMRDVLGVQLWGAQSQIVKALAKHDRVAVASANAVGKSFVASCLVPWYLCTRIPAYVVVSGSSWRTVSKVLWPEIRQRVRGAKPPVCDMGTLLKTEWDIADQYGAFTVSPDAPENFAGFRTRHGVMVIVDEASALDYETLDAIEGLCSTKGSKVLLIGNPLRNDGPFYDVFHSPVWHCMHVSAFQSPNVRVGKNVIPGLATREWVQQRFDDWGEGSPTWQARVEGRFPEAAEDAIIPLWWAEEAARRPKSKTDYHGPVRIGVDVARFGADKTVIQVVRGRVALMPQVYAKTSITEVIGLVKRAVVKYGPDRVHIDDVGLGGGVTDALDEAGIDCVGVNVAKPAVDSARFHNLRSEAWWRMREWVDAEGVLPHHRGLLGALSAPRYKLDSRGRIALESKDVTRKRLKRSPDEADALMLALCEPFGTIELA